MEILSNMRFEIFLTLMILFLLIVWFVKKGKTDFRSILFPVNVLLVIPVILGFFPSDSGSLFNNMFFTGDVTVLQKMILGFGTFLISLQSYDWLKKNPHAIEFYILMISTLLGMFLMLSSKNFLMLYVGLEMATLPMTALAAFEKKEQRSAEAGIKLILNSMLSSAIFLFGISILYGTSGTVDFAGIAGMSAEKGMLFANGTNPSFGGKEYFDITALAFVFIFSGFAFKISVVPFHLWTADVYEGSPVAITAFLSVISKSAVVFVFISVLFSVFREFSSLWLNILTVTSVLTMTLGNIFALRQNNMKRFLAFSSIAQAGYILLGIIGNSHLGYTAVIYFILIYIFSNLGAFGVVASVAAKTGKENISDYKGLYKSNPKLSILLFLSMFSLAGVPPTAGFFGKFFLLASAAGNHFYILVTIAALNMIISLYYYLLIVKAVFIDKNDAPIESFASSNFSRVSLVLCFFGIIVIGFLSFIFDYIFSITSG